VAVGLGLTLRPYCRGLTLDGFGAESIEAGSYVCSLDGRHFLVCFVVKEQRPRPVFKLHSAVGSALEGNYQNRQPKYLTTAVHNLCRIGRLATGRTPCMIRR
jgi:hypothetical protein